MLIDKISIENFRRYTKTEISFSGILTILAGANNSGKTSLVQLLDCILKGGAKLDFHDISILKQSEIITQLDEIFKREFIGNFPKNHVDLSEKLLQLFFNENTGDFSFIHDHIDIKVAVSYDTCESISLYSSYLMDLDIKNRMFYFSIKQEICPKLFKKQIKYGSERIYRYLKKYLETDSSKDRQLFIEKIIQLYSDSLLLSYGYANGSYSIIRKMEKGDFSKLFNYSFITADRQIGDYLSSNKTLTESVFDLLNKERRNETSPKEWAVATQNMLDTISGAVALSDIDNQLKKQTDSLLDNITQTLGTAGEINIHEIKMGIDMELHLLNKILKESIKLSYAIPTGADGENTVLLPEESQGLGISNLIYITLELMNFKIAAKKGIVNLFIIEEPEAHMHLQMQKCLINFLHNEYNSEKNVFPIQGLLTTHSDQIARSAKLEDIRVIRPLNPLSNKICDMSLFLLKYKEDRNFYQTFFKINFSNMIFADKAILYEGDTERMYIESLIYGTRTLKEESEFSFFTSLSQKYITYAQVGGAYIHKYAKLLEELEIKTLFLTDIDYKKNANSFVEINSGTSTNSGINYFCKNKGVDGSVKISDIYLWQSAQSTVGNFLIKTQTQKEGYARTLEDSILYEYIKSQTKDFYDTDFNVFTKIKRKNWSKVKRNLEISLPKRTSEESENNINIDDITRSTREIAKGLDSKKTNFMYSIIQSNKQYQLIPCYVKEGLEWLAKI